MAARIKKGDTVEAITGVDKGKKGKVLQVLGERVLVEGLHIVKKHMRQTNESQEGGVIEREALIHCSNLKKTV